MYFNIYKILCIINYIIIKYYIKSRTILEQCLVMYILSVTCAGQLPLKVQYGENQRNSTTNSPRIGTRFPTQTSSSPSQHRSQFLWRLCYQRHPSWPSRTRFRLLYFQSPFSSHCKYLFSCLIHDYKLLICVLYVLLN